MSDLDRSEDSRNTSCSVGSEELSDILQGRGLVDCWKSKYPLSRGTLGSTRAKGKALGLVGFMSLKIWFMAMSTF